MPTLLSLYCRYNGRVAFLLFCACGSDRIEPGQWNVNRLRIRCGTCGHEAWLDGVTLSEFDAGKLLTLSLVDQVRKHRKRPPETVKKLEQRRIAP